MFVFSSCKITCLLPEFRPTAHGGQATLITPCQRIPSVANHPAQAWSEFPASAGAENFVCGVESILIAKLHYTLTDHCDNLVPLRIPNRTATSSKVRLKTTDWVQSFGGVVYLFWPNGRVPKVEPKERRPTKQVIKDPTRHRVQRNPNKSSFARAPHHNPCRKPLGRHRRPHSSGLR